MRRRVGGSFDGGGFVLLFDVCDVMGLNGWRKECVISKSLLRVKRSTMRSSPETKVGS